MNTLRFIWGDPLVTIKHNADGDTEVWLPGQNEGECFGKITLPTNIRPTEQTHQTLLFVVKTYPELDRDKVFGFWVFKVFKLIEEVSK